MSYDKWKYPVDPRERREQLEHSRVGMSADVFDGDFFFARPQSGRRRTDADGSAGDRSADQYRASTAWPRGPSEPEPHPSAHATSPLPKSARGPYSRAVQVDSPIRLTLGFESTWLSTS